MKKLIFCAALALAATSCKKVPQGGNKGAMKIEEGVERYSDDEHRTIIKAVQDSASHTQASAANINGTDSTAAKVQTAPAASNGAETTVNTMSAPVNNSKTDAK